MKVLNAELLDQFLKKAIIQLKGEWLLIGGTLLPAVGVDVRSTVDIDLIGLGPKESAQNLELMELADSLGLSVEAINQAAAFFVKKIGYKKSDLLLLRSGKDTKIYRPSLEFYWRLKLERQTENDLIDCMHYLKFCKAQKDTIDFSALKNLLSKEISRADTKDQRARLNELLKQLAL